jgi:hypothetical protein
LTFVVLTKELKIGRYLKTYGIYSGWRWALRCEYVTRVGDRPYIQTADKAFLALRNHASEPVFIFHDCLLIKLFHHVKLEDHISVGAE